MAQQQEVKFKNYEEQREHLQIETNKHKVKIDRSVFQHSQQERDILKKIKSELKK